MGIRILKDPKGRMAMTLTCDNDHGLMDSPKQTFLADPNLFLPSMGYRMGWSTTYRDGERVWLCPKCVGRKLPSVCTE